MRRGDTLGRAARVLALAVAAGCGMKGNPLPPLRPVPGRIADFAAVRDQEGVQLRFTVPSANTDGSVPAAIDRVEIYGLATAANAAVPPAAQLAIDAKHLKTRILVRQPDAAPGAAGEPPRPAPGEQVTFVDRIDAAVSDPATTRHYLAVPVSGGRRGRRGPPTALVNVPMTPLPSPPAQLAMTHDDRQIHVSWTAASAAERFIVVAFDQGHADQGTLLTPTPIQAAEFNLPVEFGRERCVAVKTVEVTGAVTLEGAPSRVTCVTPVDRYPPPAPAGLQAVQEGSAVTLNWTAVDAADLGGYIVLRGEGPGENMQPLMREPITGTTYQDATVRPGTAYVYSVYAVDKAAIPNVSQQSNRQSVTVR